MITILGNGLLASPVFHHGIEGRTSHPGMLQINSCNRQAHGFISTLPRRRHPNEVKLSRVNQLLSGFIGNVMMKPGF
jgi:hypothetical protein